MKTKPSFLQQLDGSAHRVPGDAELVLKAVLGRQRVEVPNLPGLDASPEDGGELDVQRVMPVRVEPLTSHEANVAYETKVCDLRLCTAGRSTRHTRRTRHTVDSMPFSPEDQVLRRQRFEAAHPEIVIVPPDRASRYWEAIDDNGVVVAYAYWLEWLMDKLEALTS